MAFSEQIVNEVWRKAKVITDYDPDVWRQDFAGAWIKREMYGTETNFGWEIDHLVPTAKGGTDNTENLVPLQWKNNRKKSDNFPEFDTAVSSDGNHYILNSATLIFFLLFNTLSKKKLIRILPCQIFHLT